MGELLNVNAKINFPSSNFLKSKFLFELAPNAIVQMQILETITDINFYNTYISRTILSVVIAINFIMLRLLEEHLYIF